MSNIHTINWLEIHEWRKQSQRWEQQRLSAAVWWRKQRGNSLMNARARRARRFIKAHSLSMVDVLAPTVTIEFFLRDANKIGARTRADLTRLRVRHPGPMPKARLKRVA
jgi:hypothetical protein